jgi:hypothetical protein
LKIKAAVADKAEFAGREGFVGKSDNHNVEIVFALEGVDG